MKRFKFPILILTPLLLVSLLMVSVIYASSAEQKAAGPYLVTERSVITGSTQQGGNTVITGSIENIESLGTITGTFSIDFTCVLGKPGAPRKCQGIQTIVGTVDGSAPGTFQNALKWTAGGDANFTDGHFDLIKGSGTDGLADLVKFHGIFQRDGDAGPNGIYSGKFRFGGG